MKCIIHYENQSKYSRLKHLSEINIERINQARDVRQKIGGVHRHSQIETIPDAIDHEKHGVHLNPCYARLVVY